ncbi:hypothetical protein HMPREF1863_00784 [Aedoeadaptatus coxii]|uniref:Uncharacterized protein n=2 Tax=Aedoeadaptatus coxii TaxID=755172 RepID=A0A134AH65_9FIRM|nr:hypothetical protein HMPREF1863_00784 [Peptoniphilus coxii]
MAEVIMTIDKKKFLNILKSIDTFSIVLALFLAFTQPYVHIYDKAGKIVEHNAMLQVLIVLLVIIGIVPIFRNEIKQIQKNKKPFHITKKINSVHMERVNFIVAIVFALCPLVFVPFAVYRYADQGLRAQMFYAAFYVFVYIGIGSRLQMKIALNAGK